MSHPTISNKTKDDVIGDDSSAMTHRLTTNTAMTHLNDLFNLVRFRYFAIYAIMFLGDVYIFPA